MTLEPLVSVVVNNYNYGRFLQVAVDSALNQTYPHTEVIVVDDGSTDDSRETMARYEKRILRVLKKNGGQASAFNAGFEASQGEVVIFLDADDLLLPEAAERVVAAWRPGLAKVQYPLEIIDAEGRLKGVSEPAGSSMPSGDLRSTILSNGAYTSSPTSGNAFAREVLDEILPMQEQEWRTSADGYLITLAPFLGEVLSLSESLGCYRIHHSNNYATHEMDPAKIRNAIAHDLQKQQLINEFGTRKGLEVAEDLVLRVPSHVRYRIASLRLEPTSHPCPEDRRWSLTLNGIGACWRNPEFRLRKKVFYSIWFTLMALSPQPVLRPLVSLGLMRSKRPRVIELLINAASSQGNGRGRH